MFLTAGIKGSKVQKVSMETMKYREPISYYPKSFLWAGISENHSVFLPAPFNVFQGGAEDRTRVLVSRVCSEPFILIWKPTVWYELPPRKWYFPSRNICTRWFSAHHCGCACSLRGPTPSTASPLAPSRAVCLLQAPLLSWLGEAASLSPTFLSWVGCFPLVNDRGGGGDDSWGFFQAWGVIVSFNILTVLTALAHSTFHATWGLSIVLQCMISRLAIM